ncbi:MAG: hypothetical protein ABI947_16770 [Chloroflexota bacterium]
MDVLTKSVEHEFYLGGYWFPLDNEKAETHKVICRMLDIPPFHPAHVINVLILGDMGELMLAIQKVGKSTATDIPYAQWMHSVLDALKNHTPLPDQLPHYFGFHVEHTKLSTPQIKWFLNEIEHIKPDELPDCGDFSEFDRDGQCRYRQVLIADQALHSFTEANPEEATKCTKHKEFFLSLFKLAASSIKDEASSKLLIAMQRYYFGLNYMLSTDFIFPLISAV